MGNITTNINIASYSKAVETDRDFITANCSHASNMENLNIKVPARYIFLDQCHFVPFINYFLHSISPNYDV